LIPRGNAVSKAFTRESDELPEDSKPPRHSPLLPSGKKNYLTPDGARRLREELDQLIQTERPQLAALDVDNRKRQLAMINQRIERLQRSLQSAEIVPPPSAGEDTVRFGAFVTVRSTNGEVSQYRIVGVDETDPDRGWVSWLSPIARALLNARSGQCIRLELPSGEERLDILSVNYEAP
jgi:transcription elongation factor GreB